MASRCAIAGAAEFRQMLHRMFRRLGRLAERGEDRVHRTGVAQSIGKFVKPRRGDAVRGNARHDAIASTEPFADQRAPGPGFALQPRQEIGRAYVGKEPDADFRHGELETVAGDAMRAVNRNADPTAHDDTVDQRDVGLGVALDRDVKGVFFAPEAERFRRAPGTSQFIDATQIAARRECAAPGSCHNNAGDAGIMLPGFELRTQRPHHIERDRIERLRAIQNDKTRGAAAIEQDLGC